MNKRLRMTQAERRSIEWRRAYKANLQAAWDSWTEEERKEYYAKRWGMPRPAVDYGPNQKVAMDAILGIDKLRFGTG